MHSAVMVFYFKPHVGVGILKTGKVLLKRQSIAATEEKQHDGHRKYLG